jgi:hypothetical protein
VHLASIVFKIPNVELERSLQGFHRFWRRLLFPLGTEKKAKVVENTKLDKNVNHYNIDNHLFNLFLPNGT